MKKQICIITKSYKHGGYCVAGIDINTKQWIRLVDSSNPNIDEIKKEQMIVNGQDINCFDVVEVELKSSIPNGCQTENWLIDRSVPFKVISSLNDIDILRLFTLDNSDNFIVNECNLLNSNEIGNVKKSLFVFSVENLVIEAFSYDYYDETRYKYKCSFIYNNKKYSNISLTDPIYRDILKNELELENCLVIASLPCIPYQDNLYYKFVAKIIPADKQDILNIKNPNKTFSQTEVNKKTMTSPFKTLSLVVKTQQTPGTVLFHNYEQIKENIDNGVKYYSTFDYSLDNYSVALKHRDELKYVKNVLEKTKREIVKSYTLPLEVVEKKIEQLINLVKIPFKKVDTFIKLNEKEYKKHEIYCFAKNIGIEYCLNEHLENVINSPKFFEEKWLNVSCSKNVWRNAVVVKVKSAVDDIYKIVSSNNNFTASMLAHYYQTLSLKDVEAFVNSLQNASNITNRTIKNESLDAKTQSIDVDANNHQIQEEFDDMEVLKCVANSVNPFTGECLTGIDDNLSDRLFDIAKNISTFQYLKISPLSQNIDNQKLKVNEPKNKHLEKGPLELNAWERWTDDEDKQLIEEFNKGLSIKEIAEIHQRKRGGIRARLKKKKLID